jgi:hypothetical protein
MPHPPHNLRHAQPSCVRVTMWGGLARYVGPCWPAPLPLSPQDFLHHLDVHLPTSSRVFKVIAFSSCVTALFLLGLF